MHFIATAALAILAAVAPAVSVPVSSPFMGAINTPTASSTIASEQLFDFDYAVSNWCEEGYNNFKVFVVSSPEAPTFDDVNTDGDIEDALVDFGEFTVANFGLPPLGNPDPSSLTMPSVSGDSIQEGDSTWLTVVQIFTSCPGHVTEEIGVTSIPFNFASSA